MARAEPETMSHAEQDAPAVGPESPAGAPSAAASLLLGAATGGRGARGFARGLPRLSNAGRPGARPRRAGPRDRGPGGRVRDRRRRRHRARPRVAGRVAAARRHGDARVQVPRQGRRSATCRTSSGAPSSSGGFQRLVDMVEFPPEGTDKPRLRVAVLAWRHRRRASRAMFEIEHRDDLAQLKATDREDFLGWLGMEAGAGDPAARHRGLQEAQPGGAGPARRLRGRRHVAVRERGRPSSRSCWPTARRTSRRPRRSTSSCTTRRGSRAACRRRPSCGSST